MRLTYKYALRPTKAQTAFLEGQLASACALYNAALQERIGAWKVSRKSIGFYAQSRQLKEIRASGDIELRNFTCAENVLRRVDSAFHAFYRRVRCGESAGFPRWRSARRYDSITFPAYGDGCKLVPNGRLRVQGTDPIRVVLHRPLEGNVKTVTIKREAGRWFVMFSVVASPVALAVSTEAVGIDVGLTDFATFSDGTKIDNPRHGKHGAARLRVAHRRVSRRNGGSNRHHKAVRLLQRAHAHVRNQRADFAHKLARLVVDRYGVIAVEDLNVKGMVLGHFAKSIHDAAWTSFIDKLTYKAESAGRELVKVDPRGTSQHCICGAHVPKTLRDRWHDCPECGLSASRDHVSAQVILSRAGNRPSGLNVEAGSSCVS